MPPLRSHSPPTAAFGLVATSTRTRPLARLRLPTPLTVGPCGMARLASIVARSSMARSAKTTDDSRRGPNHPMKATVAQSCAAPSKETATGTCGSGSGCRPRRGRRAVDVLEGGDEVPGSEDEPEDERAEAATELGQLDCGLRVGADRRAEGQPTDECRDERVAPASAATWNARSARASVARRREPCSIQLGRWARVSRRPPTSAMPAPMRTPTTSSSSAPSRVSSWWVAMPRTVAADAMQSVTIGVAMPSFGPIRRSAPVAPGPVGVRR
jgi:hypothetical protein